MDESVEYVWVMVVHPYPALPRVDRYVWLGDSKGGVYIRENGGKRLLKFADARTFFMSEAEAKAAWSRRLLQLRGIHDQIGESLAQREAKGFVAHECDGDPFPQITEDML